MSKTPEFDEAPYHFMLQAIQEDVFTQIATYEVTNEKSYNDVDMKFVIDTEIEDTIKRGERNFEVIRDYGYSEALNTYIEREGDIEGFNDIENKLFHAIISEGLDISWDTYSIWQFGHSIECEVCKNIPKARINCSMCDKVVCKNCYDDSSFKHIETTILIKGKTKDTKIQCCGDCNS